MPKQSVEQIKAESGGLAGSLADELTNDLDHFSDAAKQLLKFHGIYQQEDRDQRKERGQPKEHSFMIRSRIPGGQLSAEQYLTHDRLASEYANDTLRITTRQTFQFHGVIRDELPHTLRALNQALVTTFGACGDIVRNVIACPAPSNDPQRTAVQAFATYLTRALYPQTRSYHQIWLDGEEILNDPVIAEPLYGPTYLPRKFKIAIAFPGDNCVDVFTNDVGLIAVFDDLGVLIGFNLLAGGGMGMTHNNPDTYARLADVIGFITPDQAVDAVKAIVTVHRDFGDRENRKHARLKYILEEWGVERFRDELEKRLSFRLAPARSVPEFQVEDHLGWHALDDGQWYLGLPIENGRIADFGAYRLRSGLRAMVEQFRLSVRLTPQQSLILNGIHDADRTAIETLIHDYGIKTVEQFSNLRRYGLACVALPTCGLAITEAERVFPSVISEFEQVLTEIGLPNESISMRITGCPNGCARPYVAEIAFVGRSLDKYTIFLGGSAVGTRLALPFMDLVPLDQLTTVLRPVLRAFGETRLDGEAFGDFVHRVGIPSLRILVSSYESAAD